MSDKFDYLESLIEDLSKNDKYIVLVFLLKAQYVEYGLKYLLGWYPYKPDNYIDADFMSKASMGRVIKKINELNDEYLLEITGEAEKFLTTRNEITHHLLTSEKSIDELKDECFKKMTVANEIELKIHRLIDFVDDSMYGSFY